MSPRRKSGAAARTQPAAAGAKTKKGAASGRRKAKAAEIVSPAPVEDEESVEDAEVIEPELVTESLAAEPIAAEVVEASDGDAGEDLEPRRDRPTPDGASREAAGALVPADSLNRYLSEIRRHPILDAEQEHALAVRWREEGDRDAAARLVTANLRLVVMIARQYQRAFRNLLDLVQEGNVGLLEAVKNFDPYRGVRLPSYAVWWIRAYIIRYVMNNWRMVKIGTTQAQRRLFFNLQREKERLEREGFRPDQSLIAERLSVKESEVVEMEQRLSGRDVSVDTPIGEDGDASMLDFLPSATGDAEARYGDAEVRDMVARRIHEFGATLADKEKVIFLERMVAEEPLTLQEIGERYGISRERVRQLEERLKKRLRAYLVSAIPDISDVDVRMSLEESKKP